MMMHCGSPIIPQNSLEMLKILERKMVVKRNQLHSDELSAYNFLLTFGRPQDGSCAIFFSLNFLKESGKQSKKKEASIPL